MQPLRFGMLRSPHTNWRARVAAIDATGRVALHHHGGRMRNRRRTALAGDGTVTGYGLGAQNVRYGLAPPREASLGWPLGIEPFVHLRTYDFESDSLSGSRSAAWAIGGWAGVNTGFIGDVLQVGVTGFTSQRL